MEKRVDIGGALSFGFEKIKEQPGLLLGIGGFLFVLMIVQNAANFVLAESALGPLVSLAFFVLFLYLYAGIFPVLMRVVEGEQPSFGEIFGGGAKVLPYLAVSLVFGLMVGIGSVFLVIPGLILMTIFLYAPIVVLVEEVGIMESFGRAAELSKGVRLMLFVFIVVVGLVGFVGFLLLLVGSIFTIPLTATAFMWQLRQLQLASQPQQAITQPV